MRAGLVGGKAQVEEVERGDEVGGKKTRGEEGQGNGNIEGTAQAEEAEEQEEKEEKGEKQEEEKAWLHLHENVGAEDIENRRKEVEGMFKAWAGETGAVETGVEHVELVKTFAPGVWHVVFDVLVRTG